MIHARIQEFVSSHLKRGKGGHTLRDQLYSIKEKAEKQSKKENGEKRRRKKNDGKHCIQENSSRNESSSNCDIVSTPIAGILKAQKLRKSNTSQIIKKRKLINEFQPCDNVTKRSSRNKKKKIDNDFIYD